MVALDHLNSGPIPGILKELRPLTDALLIGFGLETEDGEAYALRKLKDKRLDAIVLSYANRPDSGLESDTNEGVLFFSGSTKAIALPLESKLDMAHRILTAVGNGVRRKQSKATR